MSIEEDADAYRVLLDDRPLRTPAKALLSLPTRAMAEAVAAEWEAQPDEIDPLSMPVTRAANVAIDRVSRQRDEVVALTAAYGETDLLCYRADGPEALVERQAANWDPLLEWAATELGAPLRVTQGIVHLEQPAESLASLRGHVDRLPTFQLVALHELVALSGSLIIGLAVVMGRHGPEMLWEASRVDERWQEEMWGVDEEAAEVEAGKRRDFLQAALFHGLCCARG